MVEPGDAFDDIPEDAQTGPLLPPEDRLWRHPSELGQHGQPVSAEALSARRSWMASTPSRAGAWSAGIVGAVLATGVVLVGGHLTHLLLPSTPKFTGSSAAHQTLIGASMNAVTDSPGSDPVVSTTSTTVAMRVDPSLRTLASRVAPAMPVVLDGNSRGVGVVVNAKGYVLVPSSLVGNASDISVLIEGQQLVANLVGVDAPTGLAVVRIRANDALETTSFVSDSAIGSGAFVALVWVDRDGTHSCWGSVSKLGVAIGSSADNPPFLEALQSLAPMPGSSAGSVAIDGAGRPIGMVTSIDGSSLVVTPGWLADLVSNEIIATGRVVHGWLGITGETVSATPSGTGTAVEVLTVTPSGAAAKAGVKPGDLIEDVNGRPIRTMGAMMVALYSLHPDQEVELDLLRGGHFWAAHARLAAAA